MGVEPDNSWHRSIASALEWWDDAGVDMLADVLPRDWLARPAPLRAPEPTAPAVAAPAAALPDTLSDFFAWRTGDAAPEAGWMTPRIAPPVVPGAEWAVVTDMPEAGDRDTLLEGPAGRLLDRMLAAIGLSRDSVQLLPLAHARPASGRIAAELEAPLTDLARHGLRLAAPKKLLLLGQAASRAILGAEHWPPRNSLETVNHFGGKTTVAATFHPRWLLERPAAKSETWKHLLLLSRETSL